MIAGFYIVAFNSTAQDWVQTSAPYQYWSSVACSANGTRVLASSKYTGGSFNAGGLFMSTNSGRTWAPTTAPIQYWDRVASSADGVKLAASGANTPVFPPPGLIYLSTNSGATWNVSSAPPNVWVSLTCSADGSKLVGAVSSGGLYYSTNSGATWSPGSVPIRYWQALASSADGKSLIASGGPVENPGIREVYLSVDAGVTWNLADSAPTRIIGLAASADGIRWFGAGGTYGIFVSSDSGKTWDLSSAPVEPWEWLAIGCTTDGSMISAVCIDPSNGNYGPGPIYNSSDFGKNWYRHGTVSGFFNWITTSSDGAKWYAAEGGFAAGYIYTLQTPPKLKIRSSGNDLLLSWPASATEYGLQQNSAIESASGWSPVMTSVVLNGSEFQTLVPQGGAKNFYRLMSQ